MANQETNGKSGSTRDVNATQDSSSFYDSLSNIESPLNVGSYAPAALRTENESLPSIKTETKYSTEDLPVQVEDYAPPLPPDGGWGWAVAVASFMINVIVDGVCYTFGIFFIELVDYFETSKSKAALAGSMVPAMYLITGPIASALANKFGCKAVAVSGSIMSCLAFCLCILSPNIEIMTLIYGVMGGVGFGLMYLPSIVMVGFYFDKKRALATGFAVCGSGIGTFVFAPLGTLLVDKYGWKGANIIFGGICLHGLICALIFRPLEARKVTAVEQSNVMQSIVEEKKRLRKTSTGSLDGLMITRENRLIKERMAVVASRDVIPEAENEGNVTPPAESESKTGGGLDPDDGSVHSLLKSIKENGVTTNSMSSLPQTKQLERVRNFETGASNRSIPQQSNKSMGSTSSVRFRGELLSPTDKEKKEMESPFARQDIFYTGSVTTLPEFKESRDMISYVQSIVSIPVKGGFAEPDAEDGGKKCKCAPKIFTQMLDFSLFKSCTFIVASLAGVLVFVGLYTPFVYVAEKAISLGVDRSKANLIISILGFMNTVSRLGAGWLADRTWADSLVIHNVSAIIAGVATCCVPLLNSFGLLVAYAVVFGACIAAFIALRSIVFVELLGIQKLTNSFGLTSLFQGLAVLLGSPLSGAILDSTNSYTIPFIFSGTMIFLGGLVCLPARRIARWEKLKQERKHIKLGRDL